MECGRNKGGKWVMGAPPLVVLRAELHIGAHDGDLYGDDDRQYAHQEQEPEDVVEVPLHRAHPISHTE